MGSRPLLAGSLKFTDLANLFQVLGGNNCTGVLTLRSEYTNTTGQIFFADGNPVDAVAGPLRGLEAVYVLFGWSEGTFDFYPDRVAGRRVIQSGRMEIVLDALRMLDDGLIARLGRPANALRWETADLPLIRGPLVDYGYIVQEETIPSGRSIVTEGSHGNWIWVILEGKAVISRETSKGPISVAHLGPGAFVGTFAALLFGECVRTATVTATTDVHLALLDTYRLSGEFGSLSRELRRLLLLMSERLREVTDEFLDGRAETPPRNEMGEQILIGDASLPFPVPPDLQDGFGIDTIEEEYGGLSRTFKNLVHYLGTSIRVTSRMPGARISK
jgi:CRP-like cAMP-binding protein